MRTKEEKKKCEYCLYMLIVAGFLLLLTFLMPSYDRVIIRDIMGFITACASLFGVVVCIKVAHFLSFGNSMLNERLKHVYIMTGIIFVCTMGMGILGVISPPLPVWDVVYNARTLAIILEVVAVARFVDAWLKVGRE